MEYEDPVVTIRDYTVWMFWLVCAFVVCMCMKFIILINVKIPTIVGILTFISMVNATSESLKVRKSLFSADSFYSAVEISCSVEFSIKKVL